MIVGLLIVVLALSVIGFCIYKINNVVLDKDELKLPIELVAYSMHGFNVRSRVSGKQWTGICNIAHGRYAKREQICEICGESGLQQGFTHALECHEQWQYTDSNTQKLVGLRSICPMCHKVFHYGRSKKKGYGPLALKHFMKVNQLTEKEAELHILKSIAQIKMKNKIDWQLDLTYLNQKQFEFLETTFTDKEKHNCQFFEF